MKLKYILVIVLCFFALISFTLKPGLVVEKIMQDIRVQMSDMNKANADPSRYPRSLKKDGTISTVPSPDWTSGFYPGSLWYLYEDTGDKKWETLARKWTAGLEKEQFNKGTHDLGFMLFCSFGNGYRLTKDPKYKDIIIQGSKSLISRFNEKTGTIKSWDGSKWQFPVIIDNMMNLEMLFWASRETGDSVYARIAKTHALTTMKNHFRVDNSSYHVIDYSTSDGSVLKKQTHQGYADESSWARGQAWGLYGYTMTYRETKDKRFLEHAQKIADFFINHSNLPADKIPYWDFNAPKIPNEPRDASAAAIAASALLELSQYSGKKGEAYKKVAEQMLSSLASPAYRAKTGTNHNFILMHSTGHMPNNSEIDVPINYADYYFIEALMRYKKMNTK